MYSYSFKNILQIYYSPIFSKFPFLFINFFIIFVYIVIIVVIIFLKNANIALKGILSILDANKINLDGLDVVIIGRGDLVGKPLAKLMDERNATVTVCHSHTKDLKKHCLNADLIVSAVGIPKLVTEDMVKEGAIVIDVGVSRDQDGKVIGDCDYSNLVNKCKFITPWVGGIGLMTRISLLENTINAYTRSFDKWFI